MAAGGGEGKVRVGILGASGYTGAELVRLLLGHDNVEIAVLTGNTQAGQEFSTVYPQFHYAKVRPRSAVNLPLCKALALVCCASMFVPSTVALYGRLKYFTL